MNDGGDNVDEHQVWKVNSVFFYNLLAYHTLDWPSLTVQWLPSDDGQHSVLLGTHTDQEENALIVADVSINENDQRGSNNFAMTAQLSIRHRMAHDGDVNRARHMPQDVSVMATASSNSSVYVYGVDGSLQVLRGHQDEGYGLCWNDCRQGSLLTASYDKTVRLWDSVTGSCITTFINHTNKAEDVCWDPQYADAFASVGDDRRLLLWDTRVSATSPQLQVQAHSDEANSVAWHSYQSHLLLTGGSDAMVHLWDKRLLVQPLHSFECDAAVYRVVWAPKQETVFASAGLDRRVMVWDLANIGDDVMSYEEEDHSPPELCLKHYGHADLVTDVCWHPTLPWTLVTTSEDNVVNFWQINDRIYNDN